MASLSSPRDAGPAGAGTAGASPDTAPALAGVPPWLLLAPILAFL
ncbi:MAG: ABC transporter permease, partial [Burkholderia sp.]|nr:ABC transporter permease [Burkholderia sp.]